MSVAKETKKAETSADASAEAKDNETTEEQGTSTDNTENVDTTNEGTDTQSTELSVTDETIKHLRQHIVDLTDENVTLAAKVQQMTAQRLVDLRKRNNHPSLKDLDEDGIKTMVDELTNRATSSLEDAIVDEERWGQRSFPIARGEVTSPALADRSKDEGSSNEDGSPKRPMRPRDYQQKVASMFPGKGD